MGMYTELVLKAEILKTIDKQAFEVLEYLFNDMASFQPEDLPQHEFFKCSRWDQIGNMSSFYHHPKSINSWYDTGDYVYVFSRSDLKNYSDEINKFVGWAMPYFDAVPGQCLGWYWYEEEDVPTLIIKE